MCSFYKYNIRITNTIHTFIKVCLFVVFTRFWLIYKCVFMSVTCVFTKVHVYIYKNKLHKWKL